MPDPSIVIEFDRSVRRVYPPHVHSEYAIGVTFRGTHVMRVGRGRHVVPPRTVVLFNPFDVHGIECADASGWGYTMMYVPTALMNESRGDQVRPLVFRSPVSTDGRIGRLVRRMRRAGRTRVSALEATSLEAMTVDALRLTRGANATNGLTMEHAAVRRTCERIQADHSLELRIGDLAADAGLHPNHLIRVFSASVGLPPHAYQMRIRIAQAQALLRSGERVATTAHALGFSDQSHLTRHFRRIVGTTPGEYARHSKGQMIRAAARLRGHFELGEL